MFLKKASLFVLVLVASSIAFADNMVSSAAQAANAPDARATQRREAATQFGFIVQSGANFKAGGKPWRIARYVRLFYVGYALSQSKAQDARAEVMRRSLGMNNADWNAIWGGTKDMAKGAAGSGQGEVNLLFDAIDGLEDPEVQYNRMLQDKDYLPCADLILNGLLANMPTMTTMPAATPSMSAETTEQLQQDQTDDESFDMQTDGATSTPRVRSVSAIEANMRFVERHIRDIERELKRWNDDYASYQSSERERYARTGKSVDVQSLLFKKKMISKYEDNIRKWEQRMDSLQEELLAAKAYERAQAQQKDQTQAAQPVQQTQTAAPATIGGRFCTFCGTKAAGGAKFCGACGKQL